MVAEKTDQYDEISKFDLELSNELESGAEIP
jgi:hypothetical protein